MQCFPRKIVRRVANLRGFSASSYARPECETVTIPCRSNGSITLDIYHPTGPPQNATTVGIYLPRGPLLANPAHDFSTMIILRSMLPYPIVRINYRCSAENPYPTPIHDTIGGFDWVIANLMPSRAISRAGRSKRIGRTFVCGELLGGQLAAMLALTECRIGEPGVAAAALNNAITDWVSLEDDALHGAGVAKTMPCLNSTFSAPDLLRLRDKVFRKPEMYFDPFASPTLFFRSAGAAVPSVRLQRDDFHELARLEREEFYGEQSLLGGITDTAEPLRDDSETVSERKRKASRRYPGRALGLRLPPFFVGTGMDSCLYSQALEFASLLQRSFERRDKASGTYDGHPDGQAAQHLSVNEHKDVGLWDDSGPGRARVRAAAAWLAKTLERE